MTFRDDLRRLLDLRGSTRSPDRILKAVEPLVQSDTSLWDLHHNEDDKQILLVSDAGVHCVAAGLLRNSWIYSITPHQILGCTARQRRSFSSTLTEVVIDTTEGEVVYRVDFTIDEAIARDYMVEQAARQASRLAEEIVLVRTRSVRESRTPGHLPPPAAPPAGVIQGGKQPPAAPPAQVIQGGEQPPAIELVRETVATMPSEMLEPGLAEEAVQIVIPAVQRNTGTVEPAEHADLAIDFVHFYVDLIRRGAVSFDDLNAIAGIDDEAEHPVNPDEHRLQQDSSRLVIMTLQEQWASQPGLGSIWMERPWEMTYLPTWITSWFVVVTARLVKAGRLRLDDREG